MCKCLGVFLELWSKRWYMRDTQDKLWVYLHALFGTRYENKIQPTLPALQNYRQPSARQLRITYTILTYYVTKDHIDVSNALIVWTVSIQPCVFRNKQWWRSGLLLIVIMGRLDWLLSR